ncbi:MAG: hemolysin family protein, partial [Vicinamibacterales bacterium]
ERQLTLSSLALARNLALVGVTAVVVFLVLREWEGGWLAVTVTAFATAGAFMLLQALSRFLVAEDPVRWQKTLRPFVAFVRIVLRGPVLLLDAPMGVVLRSWQRRQAAAGGEEELILLAEMDDASAALEEDEREMIRGVMEMEFTTVREVMVPRTDVVAVELKDGFEKVAQIMVDRGLSRIPIYEENIDNIIGIAYGKQVMKHLADNNGARPELRDIIRPAHFVPESKMVDDTLGEMRQKQLSIAIVIDEYGGTAGLVTIEDLLEEIVGEIRDEFDVEEQQVQLLPNDEAIVDARVSIDELSEMFHVEIQKNDFDSIGGFIVHELGRMPSVGDDVRVDGISLKVMS